MSEEFWRTASTVESNHCVVVGSGQWATSSYSASNGNCVKVNTGALIKCSDANCTDGLTCGEMAVLVCDSKDPNGPVLTFTPGEWNTFVDGVKAGMFDLAAE